MQDNHVKFSYTGPPEGLEKLLATEARGNAYLLELLRQQFAAAQNGYPNGQMPYDYETMAAAVLQHHQNINSQRFALPAAHSPLALPAGREVSRPAGDRLTAFESNTSSFDDLVRTLDVSPIYHSNRPIDNKEQFLPTTVVNPKASSPKRNSLPLFAVAFGVAIVIVGIVLDLPGKFSGLNSIDSIPADPANLINPDEGGSGDSPNPKPNSNSSAPVTTPIDGIRNRLESTIAPQP